MKQLIRREDDDDCDYDNNADHEGDLPNQLLSCGRHTCLQENHNQLFVNK